MKACSRWPVFQGLGSAVVWYQTPVFVVTVQHFSGKARLRVPTEGCVDIRRMMVVAGRNPSSQLI